MSGHSKWNNIKRKKGKADAERGHVFTKISREIAVAVKSGGSNIEGNSRLKDIISKAKAANIPNDNIMRAIKKAAGETDAEYFAMTYEGYGLAGVAVIVECLTDNKNRTAADVRHIFDKCGGNLGTGNCVSYMFTRKGQIIILDEDVSDEDKLMMTAIEAGAEDCEYEDGVFEITTSPEDFSTVRQALEDEGYEFESADISMIPSTLTKLTDAEQIEKMYKMLDMFDDNDDVQNVYHNWDMPETEEDD